MSNYYPIDELEDVDLDFLLKRLKANGVFPNLSEAEVLHLICWHEQNGYIKLFTEGLASEYVGAVELFPEEMRADVDLKGKNYLSILEFDKCEDKDLNKALQGQPSHYYVWGIVYAHLHDFSSFKGRTVKDLPIDYICISQADVTAIETGKFKELGIKEKREAKLREYISKIDPSFLEKFSTYADGWDILVSEYGKKLFSDELEQTKARFFNDAGIKGKRYRDKKPNVVNGKNTRK